MAVIDPPFLSMLDDIQKTTLGQSDSGDGSAARLPVQDSSDDDSARDSAIQSGVSGSDATNRKYGHSLVLSYARLRTLLQIVLLTELRDMAGFGSSFRGETMHEIRKDARDVYQGILKGVSSGFQNLANWVSRWNIEAAADGEPGSKCTQGRTGDRLGQVPPGSFIPCNDRPLLTYSKGELFVPVFLESPLQGAAFALSASAKTVSTELAVRIYGQFASSVADTIAMHFGTKVAPYGYYREVGAWNLSHIDLRCCVPEFKPLVYGQMLFGLPISCSFLANRPHFVQQLGADLTRDLIKVCFDTEHTPRTLESLSHVRTFLRAGVDDTHDGCFDLLKDSGLITVSKAGAPLSDGLYVTRSAKGPTVSVSDALLSAIIKPQILNRAADDWVDFVTFDRQIAPLVVSYPKFIWRIDLEQGEFADLGYIAV